MQILDKNCTFVPKNFHLFLKNGKNYTFYTKNEVFAKNFHQNVQILHKKCSFVPKMYIWGRKMEKTFVPEKCTFYTKNEVFAKKFHLHVHILHKNCSFVPKNVHLVQKNKKIVLFTLKMKFLPNNFTKMYKFCIKTVVLYPKMYIWSWKNKIFVLFTLKMKFLPKYFTKM